MVFEGVYRTPLGTPPRLFGLPPGSAHANQWGMAANGEDGRFLYLTRQKTKLAKHPNGHMESVALEPVAVGKFQLRTGGEAWERTFETNVVVWTVSPGSAAGQA